MNNSKIIHEGDDTYTVITGDQQTTFHGLLSAADQIATLHTIIESLTAERDEARADAAAASELASERKRERDDMAADLARARAACERLTAAFRAERRRHGSASEALGPDNWSRDDWVAWHDNWNRDTETMIAEAMKGED